jgi:hypothetical protein
VRSWLRHCAISRKVAGSIPDKVTGFFNWPNPSSRTMALGSTQPLTEMSTRNLPGCKGQPAHKADNLTTICEPIVYKMWEPRRLTTLWAFTACYRDTFILVCYCFFKVLAAVNSSLNAILFFAVFPYTSILFYPALRNVIGVLLHDVQSHLWRTLIVSLWVNIKLFATAVWISIQLSALFG